jgi:hypothetical protein
MQYDALVEGGGGGGQVALPSYCIANVHIEERKHITEKRQGMGLHLLVNGIRI